MTMSRIVCGGTGCVDPGLCVRLGERVQVEEDSGVSAPTNETAPRRAVPVAPPPGLGQPKFRGGRSPPSGTVKDRLGIAPAAMNHKKPDQGRVGSRDSGTGAETGGKVPAADASR